MDHLGTSALQHHKMPVPKAINSSTNNFFTASVKSLLPGKHVLLSLVAIYTVHAPTTLTRRLYVILDVCHCVSLLSSTQV